MSRSAEPKAKVLFRIEDDAGAENVETLWALELGDDCYELTNCPFYAYGVSLGDVVWAPYDEDEQYPGFRRVVKKSGNRTVRVAFDLAVAPGNASDEVLQELVALGCNYEGANPSYIVVNVPRTTNLEFVVACLVENQARWEHADPTFAELHPDEP